MEDVQNSLENSITSTANQQTPGAAFEKQPEPPFKQVSDKPPRKKMLILAIFITAIIIVVLISMIYIYSLKNNEAAVINPETPVPTTAVEQYSSIIDCGNYVNERLGWSIDCPEGWKINLHKVKSQLPTPATSEWDNPYGQISIQSPNINQAMEFIYSPQDESDIDRVAQAYKQSKAVESVEELALPGSKKAYKITHASPPADYTSSSEEYKYNEPTVEYLISYPRSNFNSLSVIFPNQPEYIEAFAKFKLLGNEYTKDLWQQYKHPDFGFSISFPLGWEANTFDYKASDIHNNLMWFNGRGVGLIGIYLESFAESNISKLETIKESVILGSTPATLYKYYLVPEIEFRIYEVSVNGTSLTINLTVDDNTKMDKLEEIVNTFRPE